MAKDESKSCPSDMAKMRQVSKGTAKSSPPEHAVKADGRKESHGKPAPFKK